MITDVTFTVVYIYGNTDSNGYRLDSLVYFHLSYKWRARGSMDLWGMGRERSCYI